MLSSVCETSVPTRTGNVSRMRPVRRESERAPGRLAEPRRQGRRHQHADHRRRGDVAAADGPVGQRGAHDPVPGGGAEEEREGHQRRGDQHPGEVGADDAFDDVVDADLARREHGQADAEHGGDAEADAARDAAPAAAAAGPGAGRARAGAGRAPADAPSAGR